MPRPKNDLIAWCRAHDWGRHAELSPSGMRIRNLKDKDGQSVDILASYRTIRAWAGYPPIRPLLK